ncbi:hypothetical protein [Sphingobium sp. AP50]|uniref:hypothetical protein n=1 Tax=Sphingobium sp. AP50 TaxID=1884369 RepID=UPI000B852E09|nr:hypothetical protein [Sphingobium sp. AP50]
MLHHLPAGSDILFMIAGLPAVSQSHAAPQETSAQFGGAILGGNSLLSLACPIGDAIQSVGFIRGMMTA